MTPMSNPTARPELIRRASLREAAPTAAQWMCCAAASMAGGMSPQWAWQVGVYEVARSQAVAAVNAARLRAEAARWN